MKRYFLIVVLSFGLSGIVITSQGPTDFQTYYAIAEVSFNGNLDTAEYWYPGHKEHWKRFGIDNNQDLTAKNIPITYFKDVVYFDRDLDYREKSWLKTMPYSIRCYLSDKYKKKYGNKYGDDPLNQYSFHSFYNFPQDVKREIGKATIDYLFPRCVPKGSLLNKEKLELDFDVDDKKYRVVVYVAENDERAKELQAVCLNDELVLLKQQEQNSAIQEKIKQLEQLINNQKKQPNITITIRKPLFGDFLIKDFFKCNHDQYLSLGLLPEDKKAIFVVKATCRVNGKEINLLDKKNIMKIPRYCPANNFFDESGKLKEAVKLNFDGSVYDVVIKYKSIQPSEEEVQVFYKLLKISRIVRYLGIVDQFDFKELSQQILPKQSSSPIKQSNNSKGFFFMSKKSCFVAFLCMLFFAAYNYHLIF